MNQSYALMAYCRFDLSAMFKRFDELTRKFEQYKDIADDNQPNPLRASTKKNHLNDKTQEQTDDDPETNN